MVAGEQKAKIARALGPDFDAFDGIVNAVGRAITYLSIVKPLTGVSMFE
jgi:hypothetical protein